MLSAEQGQILAADERKREFHEEKRSGCEEEQDGRPASTHLSPLHSGQKTTSVPEQEERSSWREVHDDGTSPPQEDSRHHV